MCTHRELLWAEIEGLKRVLKVSGENGEEGSEDGGEEEENEDLAPRFFSA